MNSNKDKIEKEFFYIKKSHSDRFARKVWFNRSLSIVNLPNAKCGQHSIGKTITNNGFELLPQKTLHIDNINNSFVFVVIRNPLERYLSSYVKVVYDIFNAKKELPCQDLKYHFELFKYFTDVINTGRIFNQHFSPQWHYFRDQNKNPISVNLYIDIDNLQEGLDEINNKFGLNLIECKRYICFNPKIKDYIRKRLKNNKRYTNLINKLYKKDWEIYEKYKSRP